MRAGAGIRPDFRVFARSFVSSMVKFPDICELPPVISPLTRGAEYTTPSSTIAMALPTFCFVSCAQRRAPLLFIDMETHGFPKLSNSSLASITTSPSSGARPDDEETFSAWSSKMFLLPSTAFALHSSFMSVGITFEASSPFISLLISAVSRSCAYPTVERLWPCTVCNMASSGCCCFAFAICSS